MKRAFGYLKKFQKGKIVIDSSYYDNSNYQVNGFDIGRSFIWMLWSRCPTICPHHFKKKAWITVYVDANHVHDTVTHHSVTAILLFVNNTPMRWYFEVPENSRDFNTRSQASGSMNWDRHDY
jgi:hypothetical protein